MPDDSNGIYSVPAGTIVTTGDTILPSQHNPWANDSASAISNRFSKDGRAPATGNWNLNNFRITGLGAPVASGDAVNKTYADGLLNVFTSKGHIFGLTLSNNVADPTNDIDVAVGEAASDGAIPYLMALATPITKRLDASWAVGSGNGGLDTGSIANGTYHVWLIQRSDTGVVDALFSTSATSPTMPTNYDRKRRIGSIVRVSGAILAFKQNGNIFRTAPAVAINTSSSLAQQLGVVINTPTGINVDALLYADLSTSSNSGSAQLFLGPGDHYLTQGLNELRANVFVAGSTTSTVTSIQRVRTNTSAQIALAVTISGTAAVAVRAAGWVDLGLPPNYN